jgi:Peptidase family M23
MVERRNWKQVAGSVWALSSVILGTTVFWLARQLGALMNALFGLLCVGALVMVTLQAFALFRHKVSWNTYRAPRAHLPQIGAAVLRAVAYPTFAWAVNVALLPVQLPAPTLTQIRIITWAAAGLLVLCALVPRERRWSLNDGFFAALLLLVAADLRHGLMEPHSNDAVSLISPFDRAAYVFQGGGSPLLNHHAAIPQQAWALDLVLPTPEGQVANGDPTQLGSYPCFGAPVLSPVAGKVTHVVRERADMAIGQRDSEVITGNSVTLQTASGQYILLAHLQAGSVEVEEGAQVAAGTRIARCGNSGNTSFPHLHLQAQNRPLFSNDDPLLYTFPLHFLAAERLRDGARSGSPFAVRRNDTIVPLPVER